MRKPRVFKVAFILLFWLVLVSSAWAEYRSSIMKPAPFLANHGEIFVLLDGSVWQVSGFHYNYLYAYYPRVIVLNDGRMVVEGIRTVVIRVQRLK